jgi:hypothetical protein
MLALNDIGGGFGGKLSRNWPVACAVSVAARKLGRAVRCQQSRRMFFHPYLCISSASLIIFGLCTDCMLDVIERDMIMGIVICSQLL